MDDYASIFRMLRRSLRVKISLALTICLFAGGQCLIYTHDIPRIEAGLTTVSAMVGMAGVIAFLPLFAQFLALMEIRRYIRNTRKGIKKEMAMWYCYPPCTWIVLAASTFLEPPDPRWPRVALIIGCGFLVVVAMAVCLPLYGLTFTGYVRECERIQEEGGGKEPLLNHGKP